MLILKRREGEAIDIHVGDDIITVKVWQEGRAFRVGITAPPHMKILRAELEPREAPCAELTGEGLDETLRQHYEGTGVFA